LQLGRQDIFFNHKEFAAATRISGFMPPHEPQYPLIPHQHDQSKLVMSDDDFFRCLGFDVVHALDFNAPEKNIVFDLNNEKMPENLVGQYDFIFDGGTMEHIFHLPNVLSNLHRMLKDGGRIMHFAAASNNVEHGFFSFSPCFFVDYYSENNYLIHSVKLQKTNPNKSIFEVWSLDLFPGNEALRTCLSRSGTLDDSAYSLVVVVEKKSASTCGKIPIQGVYQAPYSFEKVEACYSQYPMKNGQWIFPWEALPCFTPHLLSEG